MLPGGHSDYRSTDAGGNDLSNTTYHTNLTNRVWSFDLRSRQWNDYTSGIEVQSVGAAVAFDTERQVGWYYGGFDMPRQFVYEDPFKVEVGSFSALHDLYKFDRGIGTPGTSLALAATVAHGELVYIKGVGKAGILVLIGGNAGTLGSQLVSMVTKAKVVPFPLPFSTNTLLQRSMKFVHVFDIATQTWFSQSTTAEREFQPSGREQFCSVAASAEDNSSHNIYIYGGRTSSGDTSNEVFILTLPAFHWVSVYPSTEDNSNTSIRLTYSHRCQKIHEKHMVAYRGTTDSNTCDSDKELKKFQGIAIYDMSSLTWTTRVELENQKYLVPQVLFEIIGGK